jgi:hypothetical protein
MGEFVVRVISFATSIFSLLGFNLAFEEADFVDIFAFFGYGSNEITRGFGGMRTPMSTVSTRESLVSQLEVAAIDVGRVMVARIM